MQADDSLPPKGISRDMWERFKVLKKRNQANKGSRAQNPEDDLDSQRSTQTRHLDDDLDSNEGRVVHTTGEVDDTSATGDVHEAGCSVSADWHDVKSYLDINSHLKGIDKGRYKPQSQLEEKVNEAISLGDFDIAERLSDRLAKREFGKRVAEAFDAKRFAEHKQEEDIEAKAKRKRKLNWGFDEKQRWETKGNM